MGNEHFLKLASRDGLQQIIIEAALCIHLPVLAFRVCGQYDYGDPVVKSRNLRPDMLHANYSVHLGHQMIHEDDIIPFGTSQDKRLFTASGRVYGDTGPLQ